MSETTDVTRRRRRSTAEVRRSILAAGRELFDRQGYAATTQRQIAAKAGVSTAVLFNHFPSKAQLLLAAVIEPFGSFVAGIADDFEAARAAARPAGRWFAADLLERLQVHRPTFRALLTTLQSADGEELMAELGLRLDPLFGEIRAQADAEGRPADGDDTDLALRLVVGMITAMVVLDDWFLPPRDSREDHDRLTEVLGNMVSRGGSRAPSVGPPLSGTRPRRTATAKLPARTSSRRHTDEVRQALLIAASRLFVQKGFAATTYSDIAARAETSESALFRHFGSKSNLLAEAVLAPFAEAVDLVGRRWATVEPEVRRTRQAEFVADLYLTLVANRQLLRILMAVANDPTQSEVNVAVSDWFGRTFAGVLALQQVQQDPAHDYQPELRIRAAFAMMVGAAVLDDWFLPERDRVEPERVISAMSALISSGRRADL